MRTLKQGFTFDYGGSHVIFSKDKQILNFMLNIIGNNKVIKRRNSRALYKRCYIKYPFENDLSSLPKEENFECLFYFIQNLIDKEQGNVDRPR